MLALRPRNFLQVRQLLYRRLGSSRLAAFESSRIYKPRLLILGQHGMGQARLGAAILHHLDGYLVQALDLSTLVSDSTRSPEATVAQLFVEAKRHKPSVIFIPSLKVWCDTVSEQVRGTMTALLENSLDSGDAVLLMALADCALEDLPSDVRAWFGFLRENRIALEMPSLVCLAFSPFGRL
jgi:SpoVK/Ycf46/Vps4 family AAA+-type ATPase